jgi:hypothetical protein
MPVNQKILEALRDSIGDLTETDVHLKALLYGNSGVGKTVEAMKLAQLITPKNKKILFVDTGEGWVSLKNHPGLMDRTKRMIYKGLKQFEPLVDAMKEGLEGFDDYGTIVFDEFSTSSKKYLHVVMDATGLGELDAPEYKQWGILSRNVNGTIFKLLELKETHNLIFLAHERKDEDKATGISLTGPSFMDSVSSTVRENMHIVSRMTATVENKSGAPIYKREMQFHPTKMVIAKSRIGGLDIIVSPDRFNQRIVEWIETDGNEVDEREPVELDSEKPIKGNFSDQTFNGFEITGE